MSTVYTFVPLGDGQYADYAYHSVNDFGVEIGFLTDLLTGSLGFQSAIPNPAMTEHYRYELTDVGLTGCVDCAPPPQCLVGCAPETPREHVAPEPAYVVAIMAALLIGRFIR